VPSRRYPYPRPASGRPVLFVPQGVRRGVSGVRGSVLSCFQQSAQATRFEHVVLSDWSFGYCLILGADRPPPEDGLESAPFRPIPIPL
jgi:hypothetical protein